MGVVTLSASYGAGGPEVAAAVAERLALPFHDRVIPVQVAGRLGVPVEEAEANDETVVTGLWRMVANLGTMPDAVGASVARPRMIRTPSPARRARMSADCAVARSLTRALIRSTSISTRSAATRPCSHSPTATLDFVAASRRASLSIIPAPI